MSSMACEMSQLHIPFPSTSPEFLLNGNNAGHLSPQMLQRLSRLPYDPLSVSAITSLLDDSALDHDKDIIPSIDQSSIRFPITDIYHYDSSSSNSSSSSGPSDESHIIIPRLRRVRGKTSPTASVSHSSPTPSSIKSRNSPRVRGQADIIKGCQRTAELSDTFDADTARPLHDLTQAPSDVAGNVEPTPLGAYPRQFTSEMRASSLPHLNLHVHGGQSGNSNLSPQMHSIRKKSGEPVKPSLKRPKVPNLLIPTSSGVVQSEPTTPTLSKAVHFDAKLEHVKLFLAKQKPLAVSRDHDQTTDTSGTESDFPSFVRSPPEDFPEKEMELQIRNMPSVPLEDADVVLQGLTLSHSDKTIVGRVRVRNIAFEKWVAARFTLDLWQTTSEVTARYAESVDGGMFDIFTFSIRLHDMWTRIDEKSMFIALRYSAAGRQFWDNNNGANYMVKFVQKPAVRKASAATELLTEDSAPALTPGMSLSSRHHRGLAIKIPGGGTLPPLSPGMRSPTYPTEFSSVWSKHASRHSRSVTIGSTRELEKREQSHIVRSDPVEFEFPLSAPKSRTGRERNHSRGYFDRPLSGTPRKTRPSPALLSLPEEQSPTRGGDPIKGIPSLFERFTAQSATRASSESTDLSAVSDSSSRSTPLTTPGPGTPDSDGKPSLNDSYSQFLNQFCFFTGSNSLMNHTPSSITRSHSASDVEAFLLSHSPHHFSPPLRDSAFNGPRSSSFDNIAASHTHRGKSMLASAA